MQHLSLLFLCSLLGTALAVDEITVRGSTKYEIALQNFAGNSGPQATADLAEALRRTGRFTIARRPENAFHVQGSAEGTAIRASLLDQRGQVLFRRSYELEDPRANIQHLTDDIVATIAGAAGPPLSGWIVFTAGGRGRKELYTCDSNGQNVRQLTNDGAISVAPSFSPNGAWVAYTSYRSGYPDIYTVDLRSGGRRRIINAPGTNGGAAISPDGGRIALTMSFQGNKELYVTSSGGGGARRLTTSSGSESSPTWSPNGREIIYCSDQTGRPQLYRIPSSGGRPMPLNLGFSYCTEPSWSPDGQRLAFNARSGGMVVAVHDFGSGRTRVLRAGEDPTWAPDSRHLAFSSGGALYRVNVDTGASARLAPQVSGISEPSWSR